ncbi:MAG: beta strand repeat-containing protein [Thermoanaerobaculia bacterium]
MSLLFGATAFAQYQTPAVDGTVGGGEYAHSGSDYSMTWDATYLYVAKTNLDVDSQEFVLYLDVDPLSTPTAGSANNGNLAGVTDLTITPALPFRADVRAAIDLTGSVLPQFKSRDGSGGWGTASESNIDAVHSGSTVEMRIRWDALPGLTGIPSSFRWLAYEIESSGGINVVNPIPTSNPAGSSVTPNDRYAYSIASTADGSSTDPFSVPESTWRVTTNADSGTDSLRDAITNANADSTSSRRFIVFNDINSNTITTTTNLSAVTRTTTIDGTTAPGWSSTPILVLQGFSTSTSVGIELGSVSNGVVRGLVLQNHARGVKITNGSWNTIAGNYFGTNAAGDTANSNGKAISVSGCAGCTIGGPSAADRNLIASSLGDGIEATSTSSLTIEGNYFGTKASGNELLANDIDINLSSAPATTIGGIGSGANVIGGGGSYGILAVNSDDLSIYGNSIGVGADGTTVLGNTGAEGILLFGGARATVGSLAASAGNNIVHLGTAVDVDSQSGGLRVRGNSMQQNTNGLTVTGGVSQAAPTVSVAGVGNGSLTITFSLSSNSSSATTQSMQLDLYDADTTGGAGAQGKTYRTTSPCYSGSSLTNQQWVAGSGYNSGDKIVLIATSYSDANCTTAGDGSSPNTPVITLTALPSITFTGPGSFSDTVRWSGGALPLTGQDFVILNSCTFDSGAPTRTYGNATLGNGTTSGSITWQAGNSVVLDVLDFAVNGGSGVAIDMTSGGTLRVRGNLSLGARDVTSGTGTLELTGSGKTITASSTSAVFHHVTISGTLAIANTFSFDGTLDVQSGASLSGSGATTLYPRNGAAITGSGTRSFGQINIVSGASVTAPANFSASSTFTVDGTFTPAAAAVISGAGTLGGSGTMKVTRTGSNAIGNQYTLTIDTTNNTVEYAGTTNQFINARTFKNLTLNNPVTVQLNGNLTVTGVLNFAQGLAMGAGNEFFVTSSATAAIVQGTGWTRLIVHRAIATGTNTYLYPIGTGSNSQPVNVTFNNVTVAGQVKMQNATASAQSIQGGSGLDSSRDLSNVFTFGVESGTIGSYDITFSFGTGYDAGATPTAFVLRGIPASGGSWFDIPATPASTSISATGLTYFSHVFAMGNQEIDHYVASASSPQWAGDTFTTTVTAKDVLNVTADVTGRVVTMSSSTGNAQFDSDGNGTFGDNTKTLTSGTFTIATKDNSVESVTITATDTSSKTGSTSATNIVAKTFTGPGTFSDTSNWSGTALPAAGAPFILVGSCTFDSAAPTRAYGSMTLGDGVTPGTLSWQALNPVVLDVDDININGGSGVAIDMTDGGTLRVRGNLSLGASGFTGGTGTVELTGNSKTITATTSAIFHNVTINGALTIANTLSFDGTLTATTVGTLSGSGSTTLYPRNGAAITGSGTLSFGQINIESGMSVTASADFSASSTFTVDGTFTPASSTVISGAGTLGGSGTMKVTRTGTNAIGNQYTLTIDTTSNTVEYAGTTNQVINARTFRNLTLNNPVTVQLNGNLTVTNVLHFAQGLAMGAGNEFFVTNSATSAIVQGTGWTRLIVHRAIATGTNTYLFPIGTGSNSQPVNVTFNNVTVAGQVKMQNATISAQSLQGGSGLDPSKDVSNVFTFGVESGTIGSYDITFNFGTGYDAGAIPTAFVLRGLSQSGGSWFDIPATPAATSISATGLTYFLHTFAMGNQEIDHYVVSASSPQSAGTPFTATITAQDALNITANNSSTVVTMSSNTTHAQFDSDGNGTFGDNTKTLTSGTFTISTKDNSAESVTLTATDANGKTGSSIAITVNLGAASAATTTIDASPPSLIADGVSTSTITVQAKDIAGNNLTSSGGTVTLSTDLGSLGSVTDNNNGTYTATLTASSQAGTATISGTINSVAIADTATVPFTLASFGPPPGFSATATSTSQVSLTWAVVSGATSYQIYRGTSVSALGFLTTTNLTNYVDSGLTANTTYLYMVRAMNGAAASGFSSIDPATTIIFTDATLSSSVKIKTVHLTQLRTAVNAMRAAAGLGAATFTDPTVIAQSTSIKRAHITELRTALDAARSAIGLAALSYTDPTLTAQVTSIKAAHLTELRNGTK